MHASAVEHLEHVTYTSTKLQQEYDSVRRNFEVATLQTHYEESVLSSLEHAAYALSRSLSQIEDTMVQRLRQGFDKDDQNEMKNLYEAIENNLKQELADLWVASAKERKLAGQLPGALRALEECRVILDDTVSEREMLRLDKQLLEQKVRMITKRAETAETARDQVKEREATLKGKYDEVVLAKDQEVIHLIARKPLPPGVFFF